MGQRILLSILVMVLVAANALAFQAADKEQLAEQLDAYVSSFARAGDFTGAVLVARDGEVVFQRAYGLANHELSVANTVDTRFVLASVAKTFTAAAVLKLRDQGKLKLDDPVERYVPGFPSGDKITVRHLLSHASGLPDFHTLDDFDDIRLKPHTLLQLVETLRGKPLDFEPGSSNRYNNAGYVALAHLVERVSGQSFPRFLDAQILQPLGMSNTGVLEARTIVPRMATGYELAPPPESLRRAEWFDPSYAVGSGSVYSTVGDLLRWAQAVQERKNVDFFDLPWPYGWGRRSDPDSGLEWIEQTGLLPGSQSCIKAYTSRDAAIVYLGNVQTVAFSQFRKDLETILFQLERDLFKVPDYAAGPSPASFEPYLGRYQHPEAGPFRLLLESGNLFQHWEKFDARRYLIPIAKSVLYERSEGTRLELREAGKGQPAGLVFRAPWGAVDCPRIPD